MSAAEKIAMLDNQKQEIMADLYRQQAECNAHAIEFAGQPNRQEVISTCMEAARTMAIASQTAIASINERIEALQREKASSR